MGLLSFPVDIPIRINGRYKLQEPIGSGSYGKNQNSYYTLDKHTYLHFRKEQFIRQPTSSVVECMQLS